MWDHVMTFAQEKPLSIVLIVCVIIAVIYVAVHYEMLFFKE